jgi:hypothetical protein
VGAQPLKTTFELADTLFAEAEVPADTDTVYLWLGVRAPPLLRPSLLTRPQANVMLSYSLPAAATLLRQKIETAEASLAGVEDDLEFLREQITVMEVNTARLYNWDVKRRRARRLADEAAGRGLKDVD